MIVFVFFYPFDFYINSAYSFLSVCCFSFLFFFFYSVLYIYIFFTCIWTFVCNKLFIIIIISTFEARHPMSIQSGGANLRDSVMLYPQLMDDVKDCEKTTTNCPGCWTLRPTDIPRDFST